MSANSIDEYKKRFHAITEGQVVYSQKRKHKYVFNKKYCWKQAWSDCKTLAHRQLPPYWFVNEIGDVISVAYSTRPVFVVPDNYTDSNYPRYHVAMGNGKTKSVSVHNLCALVWDVPFSKEIEDLLNAKGLYAFGTKNDEINGHHIDGDILNNHYSNIQFLIKRCPREWGDNGKARQVDHGIHTKFCRPVKNIHSILITFWSSVLIRIFWNICQIQKFILQKYCLK